MRSYCKWGVKFPAIQLHHMEILRNIYSHTKSGCTSSEEAKNVLISHVHERELERAVATG